MLNDRRIKLEKQIKFDNFNIKPIIFLNIASIYLVLTYKKQKLNFFFESSLDPVSIFCHANQSLLAFVARTFWEEPRHPIQIFYLERFWVFLLFFIFAGIFYVMAVIPARQKKTPLDEKEARWSFSLDIALLFICVALFNPNAWMNFFVCLVFPYMVIIYYLIKNKWKDKFILSLGIISFASSTWTSEEVVDWFAGDTFEVMSSVTIGTIILFAALFILKLRSKKGQDLKIE